MKYFTLIIFFFITFFVNSQTVYKITGKVINSKTKEAVAYASVSIEGTFKGVVTNEAGQFELKLSDYFSDKTLVFSNIGYETFFIPIKEYMTLKNDTIKLKEENYFLEEVFVTPEAKHPELIVKKSVKAIKTNYPLNTFYMDVFFRETEYDNNIFLRLTEAAIGIQDFGFNSNMNRVRIKLLELRKSNDYLKYKTSWKIINLLFGEKNLLYETYNRDIIRNYKIDRLLNKNFEKNYRFSLDNILYQDSTIIYVINFEPKDIWKSPDDKQPLIDKKGKLYVNASDYAVIKISANYFLNGPNHHGYTNGSKSVVKYRKLNGKYYLSYLMSIKPFRGTPIYKENKKQKNQFTKTSFFVTNIYVNRKDFDRIKYREKQQKDIELYKTEIPFNEKFWKTYNSVLINPLYKKARFDLEKNEKLENQFKNNGKK